MVHKQISPERAKAGLSPLVMVTLGDARWEKRAATQRESDVAMEWPEDVLLSFSLRMAVHGMSISRNLMTCDRRYAMQQLMFAQSIPDTRLQKLAAQLMVHFEERQAGRPALH
jgi:hypothetical protein